MAADDFTGSPGVKPGKAESDDIIAEAKERYKRAADWTADARKLILEDLKFVTGDSDNGYQWPNNIKKNRDVDAKPTLTINQVRQHCLQIINDAKQHKPGIMFRPTGNGATYEAAQGLQAVVRHIEQQSKAEVVYDLAAEMQVKGGLGWIKVTTRWADEKSFDQDICIEAVNDPLSVLIDPEAKEKDRSDARWGFIFEDMEKEEAEKKYSQWKDYLGEAAALNSDDGWLKPDQVRFAEYFRQVMKKDTLVAFVSDDGQQLVMPLSVIPEGLRQQVLSRPETRKREVEQLSFEWHFIIGNHVVETRKLPGKYIPLVPVIGEEIVLDGKWHCCGHTRALKDPQRMYNYWTPLSLDTKLPTPSGWTTMGKVEKGDWLLDENGLPKEVIETSPIYENRECLKLTFDDGTSIIADSEHLWEVEERGKRTSQSWNWQTKTLPTKELHSGKHFIIMAKPLQLPKNNLPVHPYLLGAWLGDGSSESPRITSGKLDIEEMRELIRSCGYEVGQPCWDTTGVAGTFAIYDLCPVFRGLNLPGNKHIPAIYLRASEEQRWELLRGLMDTDGAFCKATNQCSFTTTNPQIAAGFTELLRSLGLKAISIIRPGTYRIFPNGVNYLTSESWQFSFSADPNVQIFRLARKCKEQQKPRETHWRRTKRFRIDKIEAVPSVPVKCVTIDSPKHLFLAGEAMIPTHNSAATEHIALQGKSPWIAAAESIEEVEDIWNNANNVNYSVLPFKAISDDGQPLPPPQRVAPPQAAPAYIMGMQTAKQELMFASGQYQASMGEPSNERSGKAINERQRQGDTATYHYIDNLALAIRQVGRVVLDLIPKIYDTQRVIQAIGEDGVSYEVMIDPTAQKAWQGDQLKNQLISKRVLNPSIGTYDVIVDTGPNYATKREEAFNALTLILTQSPQLVSIIGDLLLKSGDFPMANEAAERLRRMVPPQALGTGPSVQEQMLMQQLQMLKDLLQKSLQKGSEDHLKLLGKDQQKDIDAYNAETQRIKVLLDDLGDRRELVSQLVSDVMSNPLEEVTKASEPGLDKMIGPNAPTLPSRLPPGARVGVGGQMFMRNYGASPLFAPIGNAPEGSDVNG